MIQDFIVDFVCLDEMLIIEVDGEYHLDEQQQAEDKKREEVLSRLGYRILRFTNDEVLFQTDSVLDKIRSKIVFTL